MVVCREPNQNRMKNQKPKGSQPHKAQWNTGSDWEDIEFEIPTDEEDEK